MSWCGGGIGSAAAWAVALVLASRCDWHVGYAACVGVALPARITARVMGEPERHQIVHEKRGLQEVWTSIAGPFAEFFQRHGAWLVLVFILVHKIGDTLANLTFRLLFNDLGYSNNEIALYDIGVGFWALIVGVFVGGVIYARI